MTKILAVLRWLLAFPLRDAIIFGVAGYWWLSRSIEDKLYVLCWSFVLAAVGYFWQLAKEKP